MLVAVALIEELVGVAGEVAQALNLILHGMRVYDVHDDGNAHLVGGVNHLLQVLRRAEATAGSEEAADVIAKGAIVGMLLDSHDLNGVVAVLLDARQHVLGKLLVGAYLLSILSHAHVALVDEQRVLVGLEGLFLPLVGLLGVPHLSREYLGLIILDNATAPGGNTFALSPIPLDFHLVELSVLQGFLAELELPVTSTLNTLALVLLVLLPVVEVTNQVNLCSIGCPLTEHPTLGKLMQTEIQVS